MARLLRLSVLVGVIAVGAFAPRADAVPLRSLPPDIQQELNNAWSMFPAAKPYDLAAIEALSPERAAKAVQTIRAALRTVPRSDLLQVLAVQNQLLAALPPQYRQTFVNGGWGVSDRDEQFYSQVVALWSQQVLSSGRPGPTLGPLPSSGGGVSPQQFGQAQEELQCSWFTRETAPPYCAKYFPSLR